ncbi:hypothetical protein CH63R_07929 [Colletotrichum higginsianum IMI 349063]|uniref:2EXR domain-containing protein n=2 Tax=Colletotrichum higginsianum (strain IMI 349063) TaxID=759273 RepID=A0A1B7YB22_COLHI|nr:hypothetical protein CH63R_07929 [Colletotrichum higginsianum IMI 349063]OBR09164.1 hypothetical protein CH63R_07929 [Colletotrichum higginsianum IMI 349063]
MDETFHPFPRLPVELRLCIWEMVIRPTGPGRPGVHFFAVQPDADDSTRGFITLPVFPETSQRPWNQKNPSSYFSDIGMWTACKESRAVVTGRLARRYEGHGQTDWDTVKLRHGQENIAFDLDREDLICMQVPDPGFSDPSTIRPPYQLDFDLPTTEPWHVAFEYDASWSFTDWGDLTLYQMRGEEGPRGAFLRTLEEVIKSSLHCRLYLIQYGAKMKPGKSPIEGFYGDGFHLALADEGDVEIERPSGFRNAWDFMWNVDNWSDGIWEGLKDEEQRHCSFCCSVPIMAGMHVDILICEEI